ncbi:MAG: anaerobic C4-dicarboxylate transporter [Cyclobacteriaceae bacterium]|jgi:anaerobic C4-dicarboxylate transporter
MDLIVGIILMSIGTFILIMTVVNSKKIKAFSLLGTGMSMVNFGISFLLAGVYLISELLDF